MDGQLAVILLLSIGLQVHAETYIVVFPRHVRPNTDLVISAKYLQPITAETVTAELVDRYDDRKVLSDVSGQATADKPEVILNLEIPSGTQYSYRVRVTGSGDFPFHNETFVSVRRKAVSIFVQTDKAVYKASDTVKYRIFGTSDALDVLDLTVDYSIYDPEGNKFDERNGISTDPDISGEFSLSERPNLGRWKIEVKPTAITIRKAGKVETLMNKQELINKRQKRCDKKLKPKRANKCYRTLLNMIVANTVVETVEDEDVITDKSILAWSKKDYYFDVQEYVLPKFEVTVQVPSFGLFRDEYLHGSVKAEYTFGKPVQGHVVLTVSVQYYYYHAFYNPIAIQKKFSIDGEADFEFPKNLLDALTRSFQFTYLKVQASVTETISGITLSGDSSIRYYKKPYKISFHPSQPAVFKPTFAYPVMVKVTFQDGRPAGIDGRVKVKATYFTEHPTNGTFQNELPVGDYDVIAPYKEGRTIIMETRKPRIGADGIAYIKDMKIPDVVATGNIKVLFRGQKLVKDISRFRSRRNYFLNIEQMDTGPLEIGKRAVFRLKSNVGHVQGCYKIISKDDVADYGTFEISGVKTTSIVIMLTRDMSPSAHLVAYYIRDSEVAADALSIRVEEIYENKVSVEFDQTDSVPPKTNVKLKVKADKDSVVNVLGVDKSVRLLKEGNDITQERIEKELGEYGGFPIFYHGWRYRPWSYPADDSAAIFAIAKLVVFTDAELLSHSPTYVPKQQPPIFVLPDQEAVRQEDQVAIPCEGPECSQEAGAQTSERIRKEFPETWFWKSAIAGDDGTVEFQEKVPDTITTWVASAFALNRETGLGVAPVPSNLTSFLPFFVTLTLPYSVIRGEGFPLQVNVFNYHPEDFEVLVTVRNNGDFVGIDLDSGAEIHGDLTKCVFVKSGKPTPVFFPIKPLKIKPLSINVKIQETRQRNIADEILRTLLVKGEGEEIEENYVSLVSHKSAIDATKKSINIAYPPRVVENSQKIRVVVSGDIFGTSFAHIDRLIRMPTGCGEQNIITFAPTVSAADYMYVTNRPMDRNLVRKIFSQGYQRQILYKRHDGSFSAWGNADPSGSLWLTAFVAKVFARAHMAFNDSEMAYIDPAVMDQAVQYIMKNQNPGGDFNETGRVIHRAMQGGTAGSQGALVAFVLIALKEVAHADILTNQATIANLELAIASAENFLNANVESPIPDYEAAIAAYANPANAMFLQALETSENISDIGGTHWNHPSRSRQVEIAAYALLAYTAKNDIARGNGVLEWLVEQRSVYGGYWSTQDTVVGLQALSEFAKKIYTDRVDMVVDVFTTTGGDKEHKQTFDITNDNHDTVQIVDFDGKVDSVDFEVRGPGLVVVEVNKICNVEEELLPASYNLTLFTDGTPQEFTLQACTRYLKDGDSGMAVMEVGVPSGFEASNQGISAKIDGIEYVRRVESGDRLNIYFDQVLSEQELCVEIKVSREFVIEGIKQATVDVYSYYERDERAMKTYMPESLENVSICAECGAECGCGPNAFVLPLDQCELPVPKPEPNPPMSPIQVPPNRPVG